MGDVGATREQFLERVRGALGGARIPSEPPPADESLVRRVNADANLVDLFATHAEAAGMEVHRTGVAGLASVITGVLGDGKRVSVSVQPGVIGDALREAGVENEDWRAQASLEAHYAVDAGITDVHLAVAETGSLLLRSDDAHSRGAFVVPPVHIAVVPVESIVPDLVDAFQTLTNPMSASAVLVSGPSKTADIEGILVTGVHGPGRVVVVIVD